MVYYITEKMKIVENLSPYMYVVYVPILYMLCNCVLIIAYLNNVGTSKINFSF